MHMAVVTHTRMITLGIFAKDLFAKNVLPIDEDGKGFDVIQVVQEDTLEKIKQMPLQGGFDERIKAGAIQAFEEMEVGDKFLCADAWIVDFQSKEAKYYWKVQQYVNEGYSLQESSDKANLAIKEEGSNNVRTN